MMPVAGVSGTRNWGYDGVLPYAVTESYGSPADLKALIDRAHELGIELCWIDQMEKCLCRINARDHNSCFKIFSRLEADPGRTSFFGSD